MTCPKNPGVAFWATVALVVLLYPISFGPACWLFAAKIVSFSQLSRIYEPMIVLAESRGSPGGWLARHLAGKEAIAAIQGERQKQADVELLRREAHAEVEN